jgi:regulator of replication initiation timing
MKICFYIFLIFVILSSCQKQVATVQNTQQISDNINFLLKKMDSLSNSISLNASAISKISNKLDSLNNELNIVQLEVNGLKTQLQAPNADLTFLTKKLDALIAQYNSIIDAINLLFFELSSSPGSIATGLEIYLPFNNNATNFSSLKITTKVNGAQLTKDRFNEANAAYLFNGTSDFIQTDYIGILGNAYRTLAFWAKLDLSNNNKNGMSAVSWGPGTDGNRFDGYFNFAAIGPTSNIGGSAITYQTPFQINDNTWHHYVYLIDSDNPKVNNIKVYQDAVLLTTRLSEYDLTLKVNTKDGYPLTIGKCSAPNDPSFFKGAIDEIRVYNRALSQTEIKYLATH